MLWFPVTLPNSRGARQYCLLELLGGRDRIHCHTSVIRLTVWETVRARGRSMSIKDAPSSLWNWYSFAHWLRGVSCWIQWTSYQGASAKRRTDAERRIDSAGLRRTWREAAIRTAAERHVARFSHPREDVRGCQRPPFVFTQPPVASGSTDDFLPHDLSLSRLL
jgi:hypothetical protein